MKAAVYKGNQRLEIEDVPTPVPGAGPSGSAVKNPSSSTSTKPGDRQPSAAIR